MASSEQVKKFITEIAPLAQKAFLELGKVHPSICIGMACVESAYGTAGSCKYHSYLGQKVGTGKTATKYWNGTFFTSKTIKFKHSLYLALSFILFYFFVGPSKLFSLCN